MSSSSRSQHITTHIWQWPVDLHAYDRTVHLRPAEQQELDRVIQQFDGPGSHVWSPLTNEVLARLVRPLYDVLAATGAGGKTHGSAMSLLLRQRRDSRAGCKGRYYQPPRTINHCLTTLQCQRAAYLVRFTRVVRTPPALFNTTLREEVTNEACRSLRKSRIF
jgi:hypothetical protein